MNKRAISVTLAPEHIVWLRAHAAAVGARSLSEALDSVIARVRAGAAGELEVESVVGLARTAPDDPDLTNADRAVRALFARHLLSSGRSKGRRG